MKKLIYMGILLCLSAGVFTGCEEKEQPEYGTIYGVVSDVETTDLLPNAAVVLSPGGTAMMTGDDGRFEFTELEIRQYTITVQKEGYYTNRKTVTAIVDESVEANIPLSKRK